MAPVNGADFRIETLPIAPPASEYPHRARRSQLSHLVERGAFDGGLDVLAVKGQPPELSSERLSLLKTLSAKETLANSSTCNPAHCCGGYLMGP
jgi:hypothetical protein